MVQPALVRYSRRFLATCFTWFVTALGAALVFLFKELNRKVLNGMLGFAAGVMIAASYFSLLAPAIEMTADTPFPPWLPAMLGFLAGGGFLWLIDKILPHLHFGLPMDQAEGLHTGWRRVILLILAITLHNFPEGSGRRCGIWRRSCRATLRYFDGCDCIGNWHWHPEFSGRSGCLDPPASRGISRACAAFGTGSSLAWLNRLLACWVLSLYCPCA